MTETLVPHDEREAAVRRRYSAWADIGVDLLQDMAGRAVEAAEWPPRHCGNPDTVPAVAQAWEAPSRTAAEARRRGWLVSEPGPQPTERGVLRGMGVAVKDNIDVAGLPTKNGTPGGSWREPTVSAAAWQALADQGAWCVGKAAMHEMAWGVTTHTVPHPSDPSRLPGGSSGGSAAVVAAGLTHAALGTDTGGSIRIPAALCGVVGLRPTLGAVSGAGVTSLAPAQDVVGPIAHRVDVAALVFETLTGAAVMPGSTGLSGLRVGHLSRTGRLVTAVAQAYEQTLAGLASRGAQLVEVDTALVRQTASVSLVRMLASSAELYADYVLADPTAFGSEARALLTMGAGLVEIETLDHAAKLISTDTTALFRHHDLDVVVTPTCPCTAPVRTSDVVDIAGREEPVDAALTRFTAWAAVAGLPAISVPGPAPEALACGIQVLAPPGREDLCVKTALAIEQLSGFQQEEIY